MAWTKTDVAYLIGGSLLTVFAVSLARRGRSLLPGDYFFPYRDAEYLRGKGPGGQVHVPPGARDGGRLLVFLHGNNEGGMLHSGLGAADTPYDLRALAAESGTILAAPSQNKNASGGGLWAGFSLDAFVRAVEEAIGASVDHSNVILMGHSGAGCNSRGGLLSPLGAIKPALVAVVDTCAGPGFGDAYGKLAEQVPVRVFYQTGSWPRDFTGFQAALKGRASLEKIQPPPGMGPHSAIVPAVTRIILS